MRRSPLLLATLVLLLAGCASVREPRSGREARMAQPASVAGVAEETFGKPAWGRQGEFTLSGQRVRYERGAERLSLFDPLAAEVRAPLRFSWAGPAGDSATVCEGWTPEQSANGRLAAAKPWVLSCRWGSAPAAMLQIGEGQMRRGKLSREGAYRRGGLPRLRRPDPATPLGRAVTEAALALALVSEPG